MANSYYFVDGNASSHTLYIADGSATQLFVNRDGERGYGQLKPKVRTEKTPSRWANQFRGVVYDEREYSITVLIKRDTAANLESSLTTWRTWHNPELGEGYIKRVTPGGNTRCLDCLPVETTEQRVGPFASDVTQSYLAANPWWRAETASTAGGTLNETVTIANAGFETFTGTEDDGTSDAFDNWTETNSDGDGDKTEATATAQAGTYAAMLTYGIAEAAMQSDAITVAAETTYTLSFYTRGDSTNAGQYQIYDVTNSADIQAKTTTGVTGTSYTQVTKTFTTPADCVSIYVKLYSPGAAGTAYFDAVALEKTTLALTCNNTGEIPSWPVITLTGIVDTPVVTNANGDAITVNVTTTNADDVVTIDCRPNGAYRRSCYSQEHGTGAVTYRTPSSASKYPTLPTGSNALTVTSGAIGNEVTVLVSWYSYYGGLY